MNTRRLLGVLLLSILILCNSTSISAEDGKEVDTPAEKSIDLDYAQVINRHDSKQEWKLVCIYDCSSQ